MSRRTALTMLTQTALSGGAAMGLATEEASARTKVDPRRPFLHLPVGGTVLFQGDSITDGGRWREGQDYNHIMGQDYNHIMGQDYAYIIAGHYGAGFPKWNLNFVNRGISGNAVTDLSARWQTDTLALKPDLLSILIGVNDAATVVEGKSKGESAEMYALAYEQLLQQTVAALPLIRIVLCTPFVLSVGPRASNYAAWRTEVDKRAQVVTALALKYKTPLVPFHDAFDDARKRAAPDHWSWDGIHPTYAGHYLMAETWIKTVEAFS